MRGHPSITPKENRQSSHNMSKQATFRCDCKGIFIPKEFLSKNDLHVIQMQ